MIRMFLMGADDSAWDNQDQSYKIQIEQKKLNNQEWNSHNVQNTEYHSIWVLSITLQRNRGTAVWGFAVLERTSPKWLVERKSIMLIAVLLKHVVSGLGIIKINPHLIINQWATKSYRFKKILYLADNFSHILVNSNLRRATLMTLKYISVRLLSL